MASITIGTAEGGQVISATTGDTVVIRLPENPTTGVRWEFDRLDEALQLVGDDYEHQTGGGIGASAIRVLTLQGQRTGQFPVNLKRWQKWEGAPSIDATFSFTLQIESSDAC